MATLAFASAFVQLRRRNQAHASRSFLCTRTKITASQSLPDASTVVSPDEWDLRLGSPSKINLFLRVMGKREDGTGLAF